MRTNVSLLSSGAVLLILLAGFAPACGGGSPASPEPLASATSSGTGSQLATEPTSSVIPITFDLLDGSLSLTTAAGDVLTGRYTGVVVYRQTGVATLEVVVTGGSGAFSGLTGTMTGTGKGAFVGDGHFSLTLAGKLTTARSSQFQLRMAVEGTSVASCTPPGPIVVTQTASGSGAKVGDGTATLQHQVSDTACMEGL